MLCSMGAIVGVCSVRFTVMVPWDVQARICFLLASNTESRVARSKEGDVCSAYFWRWKRNLYRAMLRDTLGREYHSSLTLKDPN